MLESLLDQAKKIKSKIREKNNIEGMEELALAWVHGEINVTQIARVLNLPNTGHQTYAKIAHALKDHIINKK